ncbi:1-acyl-sn-glycerol-3-phosphate acyltransferase [Clostridium sp. P21]|uniref:1-acyl-sn-glycerol-3-phosphate acyltransferase n=1 Tax=Clostridium muellerianum TaxID=2716538 RepID=A0A7Y0EJX2_9CLOT|nr:lysophospholipid acyltransferase family protein [Clostridium muellerianum]NMM64820.1 1-acyl-sn-glycerol-3-phosphate acyltransferase [Clostridium muellerianum]
MIKLLWYSYFGVYLLIKSIETKINLLFLKEKSQEAIDKCVYKRSKEISDHVLKKSKTSSLVIGRENVPEGPCVFISNHQAIFDCFLIYSNIHRLTGFMAKKEIKSYPLISNWLNVMHSAFIDRKNIREGMKSISQGVENLKKGYSMIIFPEGTRSLKSEMGEFKKGSMKLAIKANVPIVPITVDGTYRVLEVGNKVCGNKVKMIIHKPIYIDNLSQDEKKGLSEMLHGIIKNGLEELKKN